MRQELDAQSSAVAIPERLAFACFGLLGESCLVLEDGEARDGSVLIGELHLHGRRFVVALHTSRPSSTSKDSHRLSRLGWLQLTRREREIALLVAQGCLTKQVAHELGLSPHTVITYINRIFAKLLVHNRAEMVAVLMSQMMKYEVD